MKNQFTSRIVKLTFAFMFVLIASSCSEDNDVMDAAVLEKDQINSEILAKGAKVSEAAVSAMEFSEPACVGIEHSFIINNTETGPSNGINIQYEVTSGVWQQLYQIGQAVNTPTSFIFTFTEAGTYALRYKMDGSSGFVNGGSITVVDCNPCDEASFGYSTTDNQNITFTYNHGEEVSNVTISFTFPQVMNSQLNGDGKYIGEDGKLYDVNNATNQTVFTWTGEVSCKSGEAETFEFSFTPDCSAPPANDGQALVWTDAKIVAIEGVALVDDLLTLENEGPYSLKGSLENIVYSGCPTN